MENSSRSGWPGWKERETPKEFRAILPGADLLNEIHTLYHGPESRDPRPLFNAGTYGLIRECRAGCAGAVFWFMSTAMFLMVLSGSISPKGRPSYQFPHDLFDHPDLAGVWMRVASFSLLALFFAALGTYALLEKSWLVFEPDRLTRYWKFLRWRSFKSLARGEAAAAESYRTRSAKNRLRHNARLTRRQGPPLDLAGDVSPMAAEWLAQQAAAWAGVEYRDVPEGEEGAPAPATAAGAATATSTATTTATSTEEKTETPLICPATFVEMPRGETERYFEPLIEPGGSNHPLTANARAWEVREHSWVSVLLLALVTGFLALIFCPLTATELSAGFFVRSAFYFLFGFISLLSVFTLLVELPLNLERLRFMFDDERFAWRFNAYGRVLSDEIARADVAGVVLLSPSNTLGAQTWRPRVILADGSMPEWPKLFFFKEPGARWLARELADWAKAPLRDDAPQTPQKRD